MKRFIVSLTALSLSIVAAACGSDVPPNPAGTDVDGGALDGGDLGDGGTDSGRPLTIGGTVSGLSGTGLTLSNGSETLAVPSNGGFKFRMPLATGAAYAVTVASQPSSPTQVCTVANGTGTVAGVNVTSVAVTCTTAKLKIGGTLIGVAGAGLVLQNNHGDDLALSANGTFAFATPVGSGNAFSVSVKTQPSNPTQTCVVTGGSGTVGAADVASVTVNCQTNRFAVGGQIAGLTGTVVLQNAGGDDLTVTSNGTFAFATPMASGAMYAVTVKTQPSNPTQTCSVSNGSGSVTSAAITSVQITCSANTYTVGGTVIGLGGRGLVLQDNAGDNLAIAADGSFAFATSVASGAAYAVTVLAQPSTPTQTCTVTNDTGLIGAANVTNVAVTCTTNRYTVGGTVTGLAGGDSLVLQDNGGDDLTVGANGAFAFATSVPSGGSFAVTVLTQPGAPAQTCTVSGGTGTVVAGNVTSATINCATNTYAVGGSVTGLAGTLVLQDNGGDDLTLTNNGTFAFATPLASGMSYAVTVRTQPGTPSQTCTVANGTGSVTNATVTSVAINCTTNPYTVGGTVSGLASNETVVLQDNGADDLIVNANGSFTFQTSVASGQTYNVSVRTNPSSPIAQTCVVSNATSSVGASNVTNVSVVCTANRYAIGGTVAGLVGIGLVLQDNGGDNLTVSSNGTFAFSSAVASGGAYAVSVLQNPTSPSQTCVVANGSGSVSNANITGVTITCTIDKYTVGGTVSGLAPGDSLVLQDNGGDDLTAIGSGSFAFATQIASGAAYAVTVLSQQGATAQTCVVSAGSGTVGGGNVTSVAINCTTNTYTIGGTISGLAGGTVVLQDNGSDDLTIGASGTFSFSTPIASSATYAVTVLTNPSSPWQTCTVSSDTGTVSNANVTSVSIACAINIYTIGGTVSGLASGESVVLQDNGADNLTVNADGTFSFATSLPSGSAYTVTVLTNPAAPIAQTCTVSGGGGMVTNANIANVAVTCTANTYAIGGAVTGLVGTGLVLQDNGGDDLSINANGTFAFATTIASGATYSVTILTQPTGQTCAVLAGSGTVANADITSVAVRCNQVIYTMHLASTGAASGWYMSAGGAANHYATNPNYLVGWNGTSLFRDYFVFDLGTIPSGAIVTDVTLSATNPCSAGAPAPWAAYFYSSDSTAIGTLEATQSGSAGQAIWTTLGSGAALGSVNVTNLATNPQTMSFNSSGIASVQSALGTSFAIGTTFAESIGAGTRNFILGCSNSNTASGVTLRVTTVQ